MGLHAQLLEMVKWPLGLQVQPESKLCRREIDGLYALQTATRGCIKSIDPSPAQGVVGHRINMKLHVRAFMLVRQSHIRNPCILAPFESTKQGSILQIRLKMLGTHRKPPAELYF